jgi:phenylacetate-CoA ligase
MFERNIFVLAHQIGCTEFSSYYRSLEKNQWRPYEELKREQEQQLRKMICYSYENVPYYHRLFNSLNIRPYSIRTVEDLEKLPILTKEMIKANPGDFTPTDLSRIKHKELTTGGSTGVPLSYRLSTNDRFLSGALLYRGWGYGGYKLGDRMIFLAGSSLDIGGKNRLSNIIHGKSRNLKKLPPEMGDDDVRRYVDTINSFGPKFIRGYASAIYAFANSIEANGLSIDSPRAIFTTAEKLIPQMKKKISDVFGCDVFDGYGLNDGGVSAYECPEHSGLHIDMERSVMEGVDKEGRRVDQGEGRIVATSLHNYAFPFLRYDTGDLGHFSDEDCTCGRGSRMLKDIIGRETEFLITPDGKYIHGHSFLNTVLTVMGQGNDIAEVQVIQETRRDIVINLVVARTFDPSKLTGMSEKLRLFSNGWIVKINLVENIKRSEASKYKFIVSKLLNQ